MFSFNSCVVCTLVKHNKNEAAFWYNVYEPPKWERDKLHWIIFEGMYLAFDQHHLNELINHDPSTLREIIRAVEYLLSHKNRLYICLMDWFLAWAYKLDEFLGKRNQSAMNGLWKDLIQDISCVIMICTGNFQYPLLFSKVFSKPCKFWASGYWLDD